MRLSVKKDDPGFSSDAFGAKVFLNGKQVFHAFTADEEKGEIHCYVTNEENKFVLETDGSGSITLGEKHIKETILTGVVQIILPEKEQMK